MPRLDKKPFGLLLASLLTMAALMLSPVRNLEQGAGLDLLYTLRGVRPPPAEVVIITLDSGSARALGQSERPERWPRHLHARLVEGLAARGARVIGFDILFERAREADTDRALATALQRAGNVVLMEGVTREGVPGPDGKVVAHVDRITRPLPLLADAAWASGPFLMPKTPDGVIEFWGFVPSIGDHPSLPMLMAQLMTAGSPAAISPAPDIRRRPLNLYGPLGTLNTIPYARALELIADPVAGDTAFRGKAVLIGFSEFNQSRQADIFHTPYSTADGLDLSGVELCGTALANLLDGSGLRRPGELDQLLAVLAWCAALTLLWQRARTGIAVGLSLALGAAWVIAAAWSFGALNLWLPVILPGIIAPLLSGALGLGLHLRANRRRERMLEKALELGLSRQGSEKLATLLAGHAEGRSVQGVCLCSDIEAYTSLSERMNPATTRETLNRYFSVFIPVIEAHGGHVMDIVGDSAMCLWLIDKHPADACRQARAAALELHQRLNEAPLDDDTALPTRFGLHLGPVFLGDVGSAGHRELRVVGDVVNTASRIQGANKPLGTRILASAEICRATGEAPGAGQARPLGRFLLAGKQSTLDLYEIRPRAIPVDAAQLFETARGELVSAPGSARERLTEVLTWCPGDGPTRFYLQRVINRLAGENLPDRDDCIVLDTK